MPSDYLVAISVQLLWKAESDTCLTEAVACWAVAFGQKLPFKQLLFCAISSEVTVSLLESRSAPAPWATSASVSDRPAAKTNGLLSRPKPYERLVIFVNAQAAGRPAEQQMHE